MTKCPNCNWREELPPADLLGLRMCTLRVYAALRRGDMTAAELRQAAWPDKRPRETESIFMMLRRLEQRLTPYGFVIARIGAGGEDRTYRLVPR